MGTKYSSLNIEERARIQSLRDSGSSCRAIARQLGRSVSTITRELSRNSVRARYCARGAQAQSHHRRKECKAAQRKLGPLLQTPLGQHVRDELAACWSPQQIAGRLRKMNCPELGTISHESIYRAIYLLPRAQLRTELIGYLRRRQGKRMPRARGKARADIIANIVSIEQRPAEALSREVPGHWEADLIKGAYNRSGVGTMIERTSRKVILAHLEGCTAQDVLEAFTRRLATVPEPMRKTLAYDRGSEMALHEQLTHNTGIAVYFCDPHSPWQRACNENVNGLIRQFLPKGTDLSTVSYQKLTHIENLLNNRPRAVLGFKTPNEVYQELLDKLNMPIPEPLFTTSSPDNPIVALQD
jgi:transposase, IS30 family